MRRSAAKAISGLRAAHADGRPGRRTAKRLAYRGPTCQLAELISIRVALRGATRSPEWGSRQLQRRRPRSPRSSRGRASTAATATIRMPSAVASESTGSTSQPSISPPARPRSVVPRHRLGRRLDADRGQARVGHAAHDRAADDGGDADDGSRSRAHGLARYPGSRGSFRSTPPGSTERARRRRRRDRVEHARGRHGIRDSALLESEGGQRRPVAHPPLLEVERADAAARLIRDLARTSRPRHPSRAAAARRAPTAR